MSARDSLLMKPSFYASGYEPFTQAIPIDISRSKTYSIEMVRSLPKISGKPDYVIDFKQSAFRNRILHRSRE